MGVINTDLNHKIPPLLREAALFVTRQLKQKGHFAYLVGGSVRDILLKRECSDIDFTTDATPEEVMKIFPRHIPVGVEFGTVLVLYKKIKIEITTYRTDVGYLDGRRPSQVVFGKTLKEDVFRRDFTINGMAYDLQEKLLFDHVGGMDDLKKKRIQTIGDSRERFREDGLRPIRACRFSASLDFALHPDIFSAISQNIDVIQRVARERFYDEWRKTLPIKGKDVFWRLLHKTKISGFFFKGFALWENQKNRHRFFEFLKTAQPGGMGMYLAYLFYFESASRERSESFQETVPKIASELRVPGAAARVALEYLSSPLFRLSGHSQIDLPGLYPFAYFFSDIPLERWEEHIHFFSEIFSYEKGDAGLKSKARKILGDKVLEIQKNKLPLKMKELRLNGDDLKRLGYEGAEIGSQLKRLRKAVIRKPGLNQKKTLLRLSLRS